MNLADLLNIPLLGSIEQTNRAVRLAFGGPQGEAMGRALLPQRLVAEEGVCEGLSVDLTCLSSDAQLDLKQFLGLAAEIQLVTDTGDLKRLCGIVTRAVQGQSDGTLTTIKLKIVDGLQVLERRRSSRVFMDRSVIDVIRTVLDGWRERSTTLAAAFNYTLLNVDESAYPARGFMMQWNESDAAFVRRLMRRHGLAWFVRPADASAGSLVHELVIFDEAMELGQNAAGEVRYHRLDGTETRDSVTVLAPAYTLVQGQVGRSSWDHESAQIDNQSEQGLADQGPTGNDLAYLLDDSLVEAPHQADNADDHTRLTRLDMQRHEFNAQCFHGISGVRGLAACEWVTITGHPRLDAGLDGGADLVVLKVEHWAQNNLPKELNERVQKLLAHERGDVPEWARKVEGSQEGEQRYRNRFLAVRRGVPIVPAWDPHADLPRLPVVTGVVVGPPGEVVHCDELGRVKVRFLGLRGADHAPADGAGTNDDDGDSAWVRVDFGWAGDGFGTIQPLRVGMELDIEFAGGDPDRPLITGSRYNGRNTPPRFSGIGSLPGNRALSGTVTREIGAARYQQLRFDDTLNEISVQLASEHQYSQLNAGYLTHPRNEGEGEPRGEGIELRTDGAAAVRGAQGVLISADGRRAGVGSLLDREEALGQIQNGVDLAKEMGELSAGNQADGTDTSGAAELADAVEAWDAGSNANPDNPTGKGGKAIVVTTAQEGVATTARASLLSVAGKNWDAIAAQHAQVTAGKRFAVRAGEAISLFAYRLGVKLIAAAGKLQFFALKDGIEMGAAGDVHVFSSGKSLVFEAAESITWRIPGVEVTLRDGKFNVSAQGGFGAQAPSFAFDQGGGGSVNNQLGSTDQQHDQFVVLKDMNTGEPVANRKYRITLENGQVIEGVSDQQGKTQKFQSPTGFMRYTLELLD